MCIKGFVIGAAGSGSGKTTACIAMLSYLSAKGFSVAPFKVGPDFIDPGHHAGVCGRTSYNLDSWMLSRDYNDRLFRRKSRGADIAVVEGVMGLFDGYNGLCESGSTAQMAKWLGLPVVLVIDAKGMARSGAAVVKGFETFDSDLAFAGVIFTRTGSPRHYDYLKTAVEQTCGIRCLGHLPKNEKIIMPERHLGLVTADEQAVSRDVLAVLTDMVENHVDMKTLMETLPGMEMDGGQNTLPGPPDKTGPVIAVARDKAFCFYYPDNLEILEQCGARIEYFSPLEDESLPDHVDGLYFGGGYPEVHARKLAGNDTLLRQVKALSEKGMPVYGECGGFMYLCRDLSGMDGSGTYKMAGCFDFSVRMSKRLRSLGYREVTLKTDTVIGTTGQVIRGHEFHYSSLEKREACEKDTPDVYRVTSRTGQDVSLSGYQKKNTLGSYFHVHFGSNLSSAKAFVHACKRYRKEK